MHLDNLLNGLQGVGSEMLKNLDGIPSTCPAIIKSRVSWQKTPPRRFQAITFDTARPDWQGMYQRSEYQICC